MHIRWSSLWGSLFLFLTVGCNSLPEPNKVKKVEDCVAWFESEPDPPTAKAVAKGFIEQNALLEEAMEASCSCYQKIDPKIRSRGYLVSESLAWVRTWDHQGRPFYLNKFFQCYANEIEAEEARKMAAESIKERLTKAPLGSLLGLRAIAGLQEKASQEKDMCISVEGWDNKGNPLPFKNVLDAFAAPKEANVLYASGIKLSDNAKSGCTANLRARVLNGAMNLSISHNAIPLFEKNYNFTALKNGAFMEDFKIP